MVISPLWFFVVAALHGAPCYCKGGAMCDQWLDLQGIFIWKMGECAVLAWSSRAKGAQAVS
ncbi:hypothetical protein BXU06_11195 [Aquaspirillum sp. LM1]|nr:hypothetical protein BXU06_11195 [Aquaspirillum sp. LM1]